MKSAPLIVIYLGLVLGGTMPLAAHHSYGMFDTSRTMTIEGTVKVFEWSNPHSWIVLLITDSGGLTQEWSVETAGPGQLARSGWKRNVLKPGDKVKVLMHPLRSGATGGTLVTITTADGTVYRDVAATQGATAP